MRILLTYLFVALCEVTVPVVTHAQSSSSQPLSIIRMGPRNDFEQIAAETIIRGMSQFPVAPSGCGPAPFCRMPTRRVVLLPFRLAESNPGAEQLVRAQRESRAFVLVVNDIPDCPWSPRTGPGRTLGCTGPARDWIAVVRYARNPDLVWMHEFGHVGGLIHRRQEEACALMNASYDPANRVVTRSECDAIAAVVSR